LHFDKNPQGSFEFNCHLTYFAETIEGVLSSIFFGIMILDCYILPGRMPGMSVLACFSLNRNGRFIG
jgi:hypothetical protein